MISIHVKHRKKKNTKTTEEKFDLEGVDKMEG